MKTIMMNLPEGIVLINENTRKVSLGNYEFRRLFELDKDATNQELGERLAKPILTMFNNITERSESLSIAEETKGDKNLESINNASEMFSYRIHKGLED